MFLFFVFVFLQEGKCFKDICFLTQRSTQCALLRNSECKYNFVYKKTLLCTFLISVKKLLNRNESLIVLYFLRCKENTLKCFKL